MKFLLMIFLVTIPVWLFTDIHGQESFRHAGRKKKSTAAKRPPAKKATTKILYGTASFYADKFNGRKTANDEIFSQKKMTAACNVLPMGTWIKVTNLRNKKWVIVKTNDRLHPRMKRIVDLSRIAAQKLGYIGHGLARVRVEVLGKKKPSV